MDEKEYYTIEIPVWIMRIVGYIKSFFREKKSRKVIYTQFREDPNITGHPNCKRCKGSGVITKWLNDDMGYTTYCDCVYEKRSGGSKL